MKWTSKIAVASLGVSLTVSAMAEVFEPVNIPPTAVTFNNHLDDTDLSYAFGDGQNLQVQAMTVQEMDETEGLGCSMLELGWLVDTLDIWVMHPVYLIHKELGVDMQQL